MDKRITDAFHYLQVEIEQLSEDKGRPTSVIRIDILKEVKNLFEVIEKEIDNLDDVIIDLDNVINERDSIISTLEDQLSRTNPDY